MRQVAIDAAALEAKQGAFFAANNVSVATGLLIGRMTDGKDHVVGVRVTPLGSRGRLRAAAARAGDRGTPGSANTASRVRALVVHSRSCKT